MEHFHVNIYPSNHQIEVKEKNRKFPPKFVWSIQISENFLLCKSPSGGGCYFISTTNNVVGYNLGSCSLNRELTVTFNSFSLTLRLRNRAGVCKDSFWSFLSRYNLLHCSIPIFFILKLLKNGQIPDSFCIFLFFSCYNFNINWKKRRRCAWESKPGPQDERWLTW